MISPNSSPLGQTPDSQRTKTPIDDQFETGTWIKDLNYHLPAVNKCPAEVLTEIFLDYLEGKGCQIEHLLFVCRQWYLLLIHSPLLWTKTNISISTPFRYDVPRHRVVETFLQRSNGMLLDIEVSCGSVMCMHTSNTWRDYAPALNLLAGNMYRCRTLYVILPWNRDLSEIVCSLFKGPALNMVELSIRNFAYRSSQPISFSELPHLRLLETDGYAFKRMVHSYPLARLHSLDFDLFGFSIWTTHHGICNWTVDLSLLHSLRSLQLRRDRRTENRTHPTASIQDPISLPLLETLGLWGLDKLELRLELPSLRSLAFDGVQFPRADPEEVIWRIKGRHSDVEAVYRMKSMILQYRSAKTFVLPAWTKGVLADALQMMRDEGCIQNEGVAFVTETQNGGREQI